jgi:hypothetical protein
MFFFGGGGAGGSNLMGIILHELIKRDLKTHRAVNSLHSLLL